MKQIKMLVLLSAMMLMAGSVWSAELVGYWSFDESQGMVAKNSAVSGYDGEIHGATRVPGKVGSALKFNGSTDYVEVKDDAPNSPFALTSMSMSAWINPAEYSFPNQPRQWDGIVGKGYFFQSTYGLRLGPEGGIYFVVYGPFGGGPSAGHFEYGEKNKGTVRLNEWHHVAVTYDDVNVKFYIDGKLDSVYPETRLPGYYKGQSIFIGSANPKGLHFKGLIDEVKIHKGALTDKEVEEEYKRGGGGGSGRSASAILPKTSIPPQMDGSLSDPCWQNALKVDLVNTNTGESPKAATTGYICYDNKNIYIAFDCKEPFISKLKANVTERNGKIWTDDCVEVFIDPGLSRGYCHFMLNSKNIQGSEKLTRGGGMEKGWSGVWESKTKINTDSWVAEIKIPISNFVITADMVPSSWGMNLCRGRKTDSPAEFTSWAVTGGSFHVPEKFGTIRGIDVNFDDYKISSPAPRLNWAFIGGKPSLQCTQAFTNNAGVEKNVRVKISNLNGSEYTEKALTLAKGETKEVSFSLDVKKNANEYRLCTEIANSADGSITYNAVKTVEIPALIKPYFNLSYYTNEKSAELVGSLNTVGNLPSNLGIHLVLKSQGRKVSEKTASLSKAEFNIPVAISSIPAGNYDAAVSVLQGNEVLYTENLNLVKHPAANYAVKVDNKNLCMLADGKPFFPIGILGIPDISIPEYAAAGFNIIRDGSLDIAYYNGMMTVAPAYYCVVREHYKTLTADALEKELKSSGALPDIINNRSAHPAFAGYFWDEPAPEEVNGARVLSKVTRELDPYHPIMPCFYNTSGPTIPPDLYDVFIADVYWYNAPTSKAFGRYGVIQNDARIAQDVQKPLWFMPESAGWDAQSAITPAEQRIQTYLGLIYGARGIFYWTYNLTYPAMQVELKKLGRELRELSPVLLTQSPQQAVTRVDDTGVHALAKMYNGDCYLLTANNSADTEKTMRLKISASAGAKSAKVLFENRTVSVKDGVLEDKFAPYATHVYVLRKADTKNPLQIVMEKLASTTVPVPSTKRWPDIDTLVEKVGNPGFEDAEDGQPRLWNASCGWEAPEYCSLDAKDFHGGSGSLRLSIPQITRYTPKTGFGWSAESKVAAFDLGKLRSKCRYGHAVTGGLFKVDLPNGRYSVTVLSSTSELFEAKGDTRRPLTLKTVEVPVPKGIVNTIRQNTFDVTVEGGQFGLSIPAGAIYSLVLTPKSASGSVQAFDFGPNSSPVTAGHKLVQAPRIASICVNSANGSFMPRIKLEKGAKYSLSVYMKSDTPGLPVTFGVQMWQNKYGSTVTTGTEWKRYEIPLAKEGWWVYAELNTPGTVWVDDFELVKN